jgi:hypothetical protein
MAIRISDLTQDESWARARKYRDPTQTETSERLVAIVMRIAARFDEPAEEREGTKP